MKSVTLLALIHFAVVAAVPVTAQTQSLLDLLTNGIQSAQVVMQGGVPALLVRMINPCESLRCPKGAGIGQVTGTGTWELPMPTVVLVDGYRTVRFADVPPDWVSTEAETILDSVRTHVGTAVP